MRFYTNLILISTGLALLTGLAFARTNNTSFQQNDSQVFVSPER